MKGSLTFALFGGRTDEESMCRVKLDDDHQAFDSLVKRWEDPIRNLCARMLGDAHRGEDLKQDTFLRVLIIRERTG